jgi:hypothetical protein
MNWTSRSPQVYRFLPKAYVDAFFDIGLLRLSSFRKFAKHDDEMRLDKEEGVAHVFHINKENGGQTAYGRLKFGANAFVLCGSLVPSRTLMAKFNADSAIVIHDPLGFADAVGKAVPNFEIGFDGPCSYQANRAIFRDCGHFPWPTVAPTDQAGVTKVIMELAGTTPFFLKHHDLLEQNEWRFVWQCSEAPKDDVIDITVPDARQFCTRWDDHTERHLAF